MACKWSGLDRPCRARPADRSLVAEDRSAGGVRDQTGPGRAQPERGLPAQEPTSCAPVGGSAGSGLVHSGFRLARML
jgi:hypothetical protein